MKRTLLLLLAVLMTASSSADETQIRLLNPDGTPAMNVKAIGIMVPPARIDAAAEGLKPLEDLHAFPGGRGAMRMGGGIPLDPAMLLTIDHDVVKFNAAPQAIVASNDNGFAFIPKEAFRKEATLRPWAKLKLNVATVPEALRDRYRIVVRWTNNFVGAVAMEQTDSQAEKPADLFDRLPEKPKPDWRFDPCANWMQTLEITDQTVNVPPGEVTIMLMAATDLDTLQQNPATRPIPMQSLTLLKSRSGAEMEYRLPEFGSVKGRYLSESEELDWTDVDRNTISIHPTREMPVRGPSTSEFIPGRGDQAKYLASPQGIEMRRTRFSHGIVMPNAQGEFLLELVPIGTTYEFSRMVRLLSSDGQARMPPRWTSNRLVQQGVDVEETVTVPHYSITVKADETTDVGTLVEAPELRFDPDGSRDPIVLPGPPELPQKFLGDGNLAPGTELAYREESITLPDGKIVKRPVPRNQAPLATQTEKEFYRPDSGEQPRIGEPSSPNRKPAASTGELSDIFGSSAPETPETNEATAIIQRWLQTAGKDADQAELKKLLQEHLEKEFDDSLQNRRTEIERLQSLLSKSQEWLNQRQKRREEIVTRRIDEILKTTPPQTLPPGDDATIPEPLLR